MYCKACGKELAEGAKFCASCGVAVEGTPGDAEQTRHQADTPKPVMVASIADQAAQYGGSTKFIIGLLEKFDNFVKRKVFTDRKRTLIIIGGYVGALILTALIPPLRGITGLLFNFLWIFAILYAPVLMLRRYAATPGKIRDAQEAYPILYDYFGLTDTPIATLLPDNLVVRFVWRTLPKELRDEEPIINVAPDFVLRCEASSIGMIAGKRAKMLFGCTAMEYGMMYQTVLQSVEVMSRQLNLTSGRTYAALVKYIGHPNKVMQYGNKSLWQGSLGDQQPSEAKFAALLEGHMKIVADALGLNYDDQTLGEYDPGKSTWYGWGSWGAIGLGAGLSIASAMKRSAKKAQFRTACAYVAFNSIAAQFNAQYFPDEFEAWKAAQ